jgi:L-fuconolactonase
MRKIDSHQHFWLYNPVNHAWINDDMQVIQRDFLPADLQPILQENGIEGCVAVQVDQTEAENDFLLDLAEKTAL